MLAQNFKTAANLDITDRELSALIKVLGMMERGELVDVEQFVRCDNGFNMGTQGMGCGTPACIGGWAANLMGIHQLTYVDSYLASKKSGHGLNELYWNYSGRPNVEQAATALRSYLTTGNPHWDLAVS